MDIWSYDENTYFSTLKDTKYKWIVNQVFYIAHY